MKAQISIDLFYDIISLTKARISLIRQLGKSPSTQPPPCCDMTCTQPYGVWAIRLPLLWSGDLEVVGIWSRRSPQTKQLQCNFLGLSKAGLLSQAEALSDPVWLVPPCCDLTYQHAYWGVGNQIANSLDLLIWKWWALWSRGSGSYQSSSTAAS
jgi:hypothetical protein